MRLILAYKVPVSVVVDMAEERVAKVVIHDDSLDPEPSAIFDDNGTNILGSPLARAAKQIADDDMCWPSWQYV